MRNIIEMHDLFLPMLFIGLMLGFPSAAIADSADTPFDTDLHHIDFAHLHKLVSEGKVLTISADLKANDPSAKLASTFCEEQTRAIVEENSKIDIPHPKAIFQGAMAREQLAELVVDSTLAKGKLKDVCPNFFEWEDSSWPSSRNSVPVYEIYTYQAYPSFTFPLIFEHSIDMRDGHPLFAGWVSYDKKWACSNSYGYGYDMAPSKRAKDGDKTVEEGSWQAPIADIYEWMGSVNFSRTDIFYRINRTSKKNQFQILLFAGFDGGWMPDPTIAFSAGADNAAYSCRIVVNSDK